MSKKQTTNKIKQGLYRFEQPIYPFDFYVSVGTEDLSNIFKDFPHETDFHARTMRLRHKENNHKSLLISFCDEEAMTTEFIVHECIHAANAVFNDIGQDRFHDLGQDESYCYLAAWIAKCCDATRAFINGGTKESFTFKSTSIKI